ncbi:MAG: hypothetical protein V7629_18455 [Motiliproteus sp.]
MIPGGLFPLVVIIYAIISSIGLYLLKASHSVQSLGFAFGFFFYGSGFIIWLYILRAYPLSMAFPAAAGAMIIATQIAGVVFLKETIQMPVIVGSVLIFFGILLISITMVKQ